MEPKIYFAAKHKHSSSTKWDLPLKAETNDGHSTQSNYIENKENPKLKGEGFVTL